MGWLPQVHGFRTGGVGPFTATIAGAVEALSVVGPGAIGVFVADAVSGDTFVVDGSANGSVAWTMVADGLSAGLFRGEEGAGEVLFRSRASPGADCTN